MRCKQIQAGDVPVVFFFWCSVPGDCARHVGCVLVQYLYLSATWSLAHSSFATIDAEGSRPINVRGT